MTSIIRGIVIDKRESKEACIWREEVVELRNITRISSDRRSDLPHGRANVAPLLHTWMNKRDPVINIWILWRKILIWNYTMFIHIFNVYLQLSRALMKWSMCIKISIVILLNITYKCKTPNLCIRKKLTCDYQYTSSFYNHIFLGTFFFQT